MQGYSPKIPLMFDALDGSYSMNKTAADSIKQDFKMLMMTNKGERMMMPEYGVGLRSILFSQNTTELNNIVQSEIINQVQRYMSFITIESIDIVNPPESNTFSVSIQYYIPYINTSDEVNLTIGSN